MVLRVGCRRNVDVIAVFRWTKSQRPRSSQGMGDMVTNGWYINGNYSSVISRKRHLVVVNKCEYRDYTCFILCSNICRARGSCLNTGSSGRLL